MTSTVFRSLELSAISSNSGLWRYDDQVKAICMLQVKLRAQALTPLLFRCVTPGEFSGALKKQGP